MNKATAVLLIALCLIQVTMGQRGNPRKDRNKIYDCYKIEKVHSKRGALEYVKGNWTLAEERPALKCFSACNLKVLGILNGCTLLYEDVKKRALDGDDKALSATLESCKDSAKGDDRCECGHAVFKCFLENNKSLIES